ncbi:MAG TPA: hypothetical protein PLE19_12790 [Planctomycetota bacterium]|nr:hypothetical protein [Planctomycetota bacterium]HRT95768.1 hypothetical protein [Planctomycetota bacterium]
MSAPRRLPPPPPAPRDAAGRDQALGCLTWALGVLALWLFLVGGLGALFWLSQGAMSTALGTACTAICLTGVGLGAVALAAGMLCDALRRR